MNDCKANFCVRSNEENVGICRHYQKVTSIVIIPVFSQILDSLIQPPISIFFRTSISTDIGHAMGEVPRYTVKQENEKKRRIIMLYNVAIGLLMVFLSVLLSVNLMQVIRTAQTRYRQTMRAIDQANMAAAEIQRLLAGRSLRFKDWQ